MIAHDLSIAATIY